MITSNNKYQIRIGDVIKVKILKNGKYECHRRFDKFQSYSIGGKNSILIMIKKNHYVYVGAKFYSFTVDESLRLFCNIAIGEKNVYYLDHKTYVDINKVKKLNSLDNLMKGKKESKPIKTSILLS